MGSNPNMTVEARPDPLFRTAPMGSAHCATPGCPGKAGPPYLAPRSEPQHGGSRKSPAASTALAHSPQTSGAAGDPMPGSSSSSPPPHPCQRPASPAQRHTRRSGRAALPAPAAPVPAGSGCLACDPGVSPRSRYAAAGTACRRYSWGGHIPHTPAPLSHLQPVQLCQALSSWLTQTFLSPASPLLCCTTSKIPWEGLAPVS